MAIAIAGVAASGSAAFGKQPTGARRARMERSPQWKDGRFENPQPLHNDNWGAVGAMFHASAGSPSSALRPTAAPSIMPIWQ